MRESWIMLTAYRLRVHWLAAAVALCGAVNTATAVGDEKPVAAESGTKGRVKESAGFPIALIDLKYIFDHYEPFKKRKVEMEIAVKLAESTVNLRKKSINKLIDDLNKQTPGSPKYQQLQQTIVKEKIDLKSRFVLQKQEFLLREAKIYHETYHEIQQVVKQYISEKGIALVLRFNSEKIKNSNDVEKVAKHLIKPVVAYNADIDITQEIMRRMRQAKKVRITNKPSKAGVNK